MGLTLLPKELREVKSYQNRISVTFGHRLSALMAAVDREMRLPISVP